MGLVPLLARAHKVEPMSSTPDLSSILADLAAGRIDAAEASRRIDAATSVGTAHGSTQSEPGSGVPSEGSGDEPAGQPGETTEPAPQAARQSDGEFPAAGQGAAGDGPAGGREQNRADVGDQTADGDQTATGGNSRHGIFDEPWNRMPPEARQGLRSAWQRVSGAAEKVAGAAAAGAGLGASEAVGHGPGADNQAGSGQAGRAGQPGPSGEVSRVRVRCVGRRVTIIGDPSVPGVKVEGEHVRRRTADAVEISSKSHIGPDLSGLLRLRLPKDAEDFKDLGLGPELIIRMHPEMALDIELSGGALRLSGMTEVDRVRVSAGAAEILDVHQVADALFQVGGATVTGPIDRGRSRIRAESANLTVNLTEDANVAVRADVTTGLVSWPDGGSDVDEYVVGNGSARLDLSAVMGRIAVRQTH